ncbi:MAG: glycosyltransferase [bacterium]
MKIAFLGSRGIPARYSGFETFYEQLAVRLVRRGHQVTVYNRRHFMPDIRGTYKDVRIVSLPSIPTKHLDTITHTALSSIHALGGRYDIVYYCIVGNSPLVWIPRMVGAKVLLNVDGQDGAREKWGRLARLYQRGCERIAIRTAHVIVADSRVIQDRYRQLYGAHSVFVPYGANVARNAGTAALAKWNVEPRRYVLYVGRFVPENAIHLLIEAFRRLETDMKLVLIGDAPHSDDYKRVLHAAAGDDRRIVFTGYAFGDDYAQLSSHAYLAVQPSAVDGTRPAVLDQMGFGNPVVARNSPANMETLGTGGFSFDRSRPAEALAELLRALIAAPLDVESCRERALKRIAEYYNWEWITDFYEDHFARLMQKRPLIDYDAFLSDRVQAGGGRLGGME